MATKSNPEKNSKIIKRYIDKYADKKHYQHETIYTMDSDEVVYICDFLDSKKSKVFLCFYNFSADSYDKKSIYDIFQFTEGNVMFPYDRINMTDDGLELGINICVPARDGVVDPALLNEVLSHELRHVYRLYKEYMAGHISHPQKSTREKIDSKNTKLKSTYSQRQNRYDNLLSNIKNDGTVRDAFNWIGYSLTMDEINAVIAGIDAFLYENNGDVNSLNKCRGIFMMQIMHEYLEKIQKHATDEDWEYCRKNALYINERKDENLSRFKSRYLKYYTNQFEYFDFKVKKLVDKYKMQNAKRKLLNKNIVKNHVKEKFINDMIVM